MGRRCKAATDAPVLLGVGISNAGAGGGGRRQRRRRDRRERARSRGCSHGGGPDDAHDVRRDAPSGARRDDVRSRATHDVRDDCDLCEAARITPWFHEDDVCWIAECEICAVPMVVWRGHGTEPPADELEHMHAQLAEVVAVHFDVRALRRRQHAQHPRPLPRARPPPGRLLRPRAPASFRASRVSAVVVAARRC